jgi:hypothetical protein
LRHYDETVKGLDDFPEYFDSHRRPEPPDAKSEDRRVRRSKLELLTKESYKCCGRRRLIERGQLFFADVIGGVREKGSSEVLRKALEARSIRHKRLLDLRSRNDLSLARVQRQTQRFELHLQHL